MEGISAALTRIESIRTRFDSLTPRRDFAEVLAAHTAPAADSGAAAAPEPVATVPAPAPGTAVRLGARAGAEPTTATADTAALAIATPPATVTLGTMAGAGPAVAPPAPPAIGIATRAELNAYLDRHGVERRNGRLGSADLVAVSGAWKGTARLLAPAAAAWEAMRTAAAADGIDLRAVDSYRSWDSQNRAYAAYQRGEKRARVLPPGRSEHGHGLAVDVTNGHIVGPGDPEWAWLRTNAGRFGWHPISNESWHWEFRGI